MSIINLGTKELIINSAKLDRIKILKADGSLATTAAHATAAGTTATAGSLWIEGFGRFDQEYINNIVCQRYTKPTIASLQINASKVTYTAPTAALGPVSFVVDFDISNDRCTADSGRRKIEQGEHILLDVVLTSADDTLEKAYDKIKAALENRAKSFDIISKVDMTISGTGAAAVAKFTAVNKYDTIKSITFLTSTEGNRAYNMFSETRFSQESPAAMVTFVSNDPGQNSGKQLEETVKMGTFENINLYGVRPGETPALDGVYSCFMFTYNPQGFKGVHAAPEFNMTMYEKEVSFNVYVQETGSVETPAAQTATSKIGLLAAFFKAIAAGKDIQGKNIVAEFKGYDGADKSDVATWLAIA